MNKEKLEFLTDSEYLNSNCTLTEAVQIARGVAEDVLRDYSKNINTYQVSISIQLEILKEVLIKSNLITEEEFSKIYAQKVYDLNNDIMNKSKRASADTKMDISPKKVEVKTEKRG